MEEITFLKGFFDLLLWCVAVLLLHPAAKSSKRLKKSSRIIGVILIIIFCLFPYWGGDYYHSRDSFDIIKNGGYNHFEDIYGLIIMNSGTYTLFRLIVWGSALFLLFFAYKRISVNFDLSLFYFVSLSLVRFSYARVSLAMAVILLGMTIIYKPIGNRKVLSYLIGFIIICCAEFFHRSAAIGIFSAFATLFIINNSKKKIVLLALFVPFLAFFVSYVLGNLLNTSFAAIDASLDGKIDRYLTNETAERGIASKIAIFLQWTNMFLSAIAFIVLVIKNKYEKLTRVEQSFACYVFIIMLIVLGLSLDFQHETGILANRTMCFAMPANAVFLMSIKSRNDIIKICNMAYRFGLTASLYNLLYATYMGFNRSLI